MRRSVRRASTANRHRITLEAVDCAREVSSAPLALLRPSPRQWEHMLSKMEQLKPPIACLAITHRRSSRSFATLVLREQPAKQKACTSPIYVLLARTDPLLARTVFLVSPVRKVSGRKTTVCVKRESVSSAQRALSVLWMA